MSEEQETQHQGIGEPERPVLPPCCNSGCTVCVLDYPDLFMSEAQEIDTLAMLEAIARAQQALAEAEGDRESPTESETTYNSRSGNGR